MLDWIDIGDPEPLQHCKTRLSEALECRIALASQVCTFQDGHSGGRVSIERRIDVEDPSVVRRHERFGNDEATTESTNCSKDRAESMSLARSKDCENDEDGKPHLVHKKKGEKDDKVHIWGISLVDKSKHESGTDCQGKCAHSTHSDEDLKDQFVGIGDPVRVLESKEFERLDE